MIMMRWQYDNVFVMSYWIWTSNTNDLEKFEKEIETKMWL